MVKCHSCRWKPLQMLAVSINMLLQLWLFLLLLKVVKNKQGVKKPREFERAHSIYDRDLQVSHLLSTLKCWGGRQALMKKTRPKSTIPPATLVLIKDVQNRTCGCTGARTVGDQLSCALGWDVTALPSPHPIPKGGSDIWQAMQMRDKPHRCQSGFIYTDRNSLGLPDFCIASITQIFHLRSGVMITICDLTAETQHLLFKCYLVHANGM